MPKGVSEKRYQITCQQCGNTHSAKQPYTKFCSNSCKCKFYWPKTRIKAKEYLLKKKYGLSLEDYTAMPQKCEACGNPENLCVDHNHKTGAVRGILCTQCNTSLGLLKEDEQRLLNLLLYLKQKQNAANSRID